MMRPPVASALKLSQCRPPSGVGLGDTAGGKVHYAHPFCFVVLVTWFMESHSMNEWLTYLLNACSALGTVQALVSDRGEQDGQLLP